MLIVLRDANHSDIAFLRRMLYEAVFWRASVTKPSFEDAMGIPDVSKALSEWGKRDGDTAVVAMLNSIPVGAAWYRYWTDDNFIRGYIEEATPVLVIGVHKDYRHQGIGSKMIQWLVAKALRQCVRKISLMVSKDNYAINLYQQQGFQKHVDKEDSILMVRKVQV